MRLALAVLLALPLAAPTVGADRQGDAVATLVLDLQHALQAGTTSEFVRRAAPALSPAETAWLAGIVVPGAAPVVRIRERVRTRDSVLAEVFVSQDARAFVANWRLGVDVPRGSDTAVLRSITELSAFRDLIRLDLDGARQFAVKGLVVTGPDFEMTLPSGTAFLADVSDGTTAVVLQGRATVRFSPSDRAEQGQLRIFNGAPGLDVRADDVFVRVNPRELARSIAWQSLEPVDVNPSALAHAREVFRDRAVLSYHIDIGTLAAGQWSVEPTAGSVLVDFRTRRFGWLTYSRAPEEAEDVALFDRARRRQISLYSSGDRLASRDTREPDDDATYAVRHTALDLTFDPSRQWMSGRASVRVEMIRGTSSFSMRLARTLVVSSLSSPELGPLLPLRVTGNDSFIVGLPVSVPEGEVFTIDVQYHGRVEPQVLAHEVTTVTAEVAAQRPRDSDGLPLEIEPRYLYSNRSWWYPQSPETQHATAVIRMTVPIAYRVEASGRLVGEAVSAAVDAEGEGSAQQVRTMEFRADRPVRYLACLVTRLVPAGSTRVPVPALAGLADGSDDAASDEPVVTVTVLTAPGQTGALRATPMRVGSVIGFYARLMGEAPYPSFDVASLEDAVPGGHSPAYFALLNQPHPATTLSWARDPVVFDDAPDFFLAHEVAHQWWGQAVGWRTYHDQWISEGFAQYFAWMYVSSVESADTARRLMSRMRETASGLSAEGPIDLGYRLGHLRGDSRIFRSIVYNKSAVVLHMLRRFIGDDAFTRGLRRVYRTWRFDRAGVDDIQQAFQAETGVPLGRFFTRWIREAGTPTLRLAWSQRGPAEVVVRAEQIGEAFDLPYDVSVVYEDGSRERVTIRVTEAEAVFTLATRGPVRRVEFDDDLTIVKVVR